MNAARSLLIVLLLGASGIAAWADDLTPAQRSEHEKTIQTYTNGVIPHEPKNARNYQIRGYAYFALGQNEQALEDYSMAIKYAPTFSDHYRNRAEVYLAMQNYDKALEDLNAAIRLSPQRGPAYTNRAWVEWNLKRYPEAAADYQQGFTLDPQNAWACNAYAWFLIHCPEEKLRDEAKAVQLAQRACALSRNTPDYMETLRDATAAQKARATAPK